MTRELHALVIEDEQNLATIYSEALKTGGFATEIIRDGRVALARLAEVIPQVVLLDINLPSVSGHEVLSYIRSEDRLSKTQVWVVTADVPAAEDLGASGDLVLLKPISFLHLSDLAVRLARATS